MANESNPPADATDRREARRQRLRQLAHDVVSPLSIVTMGVDALKGGCDTQEEFVEICRMIEQEGAVPLRERIAELIRVALEE